MNICPKCGVDFDELPTGSWPFCKGDKADHAPGGGMVVVDDAIPGGVYLKNGLCNPDGSPRRFDSKSDIRRAAKQAGLVNYVEHIPSKGSDKSKHTQRFV